MIQVEAINNSNSDLKQREALFKQLAIDADKPHVFLSTCNRLEVYWGEGEAPEHLARHLFRVASGLESSLLGERAIQGQIKQAYAEALEKYKLSSSLNRLFQMAMHTGKRARSETRISEGAVSHSQVTVDILRAMNVDLENRIVALLGVNNLTEDILKYLTARSARNVFISNRSYHRAFALAEAYGASAIRFDERQQLLEQSDVIISATSAPHTVVTKDDLTAEKERFVFDLAFPRDVEEGVGELPNVKLYNLEDIERFAQANLQERAGEVERVEQIIEEELSKYYQWQNYALKS